MTPNKATIKAKARPVGRPVSVDPLFKKVQVNVKLPPWLIKWAHTRPESFAVLIETGLTAHYKIKKPKLEQ